MLVFPSSQIAGKLYYCEKKYYILSDNTIKNIFVNKYREYINTPFIIFLLPGDCGYYDTNQYDTKVFIRDI